MASVTFEGVTKFYGHVRAVAEFDLAIEPGEFVVLVGPSGCGKTTSLRMLAGLEAVTGGRIRVGDRDVTKVPAKDRNMAMVFQNYALYPHMTVAENAGFALGLAGVPKAEIAARVKAAADLVEIGNLLERKPKELSGGQRQRVAVCRAIVRQPQVFLFDEPLSNLDSQLRSSARAEIRALQRRLGTTTVYVTHDQVEAMTMADRIVVMRDGLIQQVGSPVDVFERPANLFVATFIGSPGMNVVPGAIHDGELHSAGVALGAAPAGAVEVTVGVRPEAVRIDSTDDEQVGFVVAGIEILGTESLVHLSRADTRLLARVPRKGAPSIGDLVTPRFTREDAHLFDAAKGHRLAA